jgi:hypothetical protein
VDNSPIDENHIIKRGRTFDAGFRLYVKRMILEQGINATQVCQDMKLSGREVRRRWVAQLQAKQTSQQGVGGTGGYILIKE